MSEESEPVSRAILQDTDEMAERFHAFGREGLPNWAIAMELCVHVNTVGTFLRRAPKSKAALEKGRAEEKAERRQRLGPLVAAGRRPAAPKPGAICPTCGQIAARVAEPVMLTPAAIAEAQKTLDDLIGRHLAARDAAEAEPPPAPGRS